MYRKLSVNEHLGKALTNLNQALAMAASYQYEELHTDLLALRKVLIAIRNKDYSTLNKSQASYGYNNKSGET